MNETQGDQLMARKLAKQQGARPKMHQNVSGMSQQGLHSVGSVATGAASIMGTSSNSRGMSAPNVVNVHQQLYGGDQHLKGKPPPTQAMNLPEEEHHVAQKAAASRAHHAAVLREHCTTNPHIDSLTSNRNTLYQAWPQDPEYLQQQLSLLQHELTEKDKDLNRAHSEIRMLQHEMEQLRSNQDSEIHQLKTEYMSQLIQSFRTDGIKGLEGLARMQNMGQFADGREKERQRIYELERGIIHDLEAMRREYDSKASDMKNEYQVRLGWLNNRQSYLEADQQQQQSQTPITALPRRPTRSSSASQQKSRKPIKQRTSMVREPQSGEVMDHKQITDKLANGYYARMGY